MDVVQSKTPIVVLSYHNCEIYCCHLDGYKTNTQALLDRLMNIEAVFLSKSAHAKFRVWYNMDENDLDRRTMELIAESIFRFREHIYKIAFIGLCGSQRRKFNRILERILAQKTVPKAYFQDAEFAKGWLV